MIPLFNNGYVELIKDGTCRLYKLLLVAEWMEFPESSEAVAVITLRWLPSSTTRKKTILLEQIRYSSCFAESLLEDLIIATPTLL